MTAPLAEFRLAQPGTVKEAVAACVKHPGSRYVAGGTDLIVNMRRGINSPDLLVDLSGIDELTEIKGDGHGMTIGAGVTIAALARDTSIASRYRALAQAAAAIAGPGHRVMATVGGNLCLDTRCIYYNQSEWWRSANAYCLKNRGDTCHVAPQGQRCHAAFSGDLAPALLVLWRRSRHRRPARRAPDSAERSLCRGRQGPSRARPQASSSWRYICRQHRRHRPMKRCACAALSTFPWRAWRLRSL